MRQLILIAVTALAGAVPLAKNWQTDADWVRARYGAWGGPGVNPAPGPMDSLALKDYAPVPSLMVRETLVPKAKYPAIDVHAHVNVDGGVLCLRHQGFPDHQRRNRRIVLQRERIHGARRRIHSRTAPCAVARADPIRIGLPVLGQRNGAGERR